MDVMAAVAIAGGGGVMVTVGIAIGKSMTTAKDIQRLAKKMHEMEDWRNSTLPSRYVSRDSLKLMLTPITETLQRIEAQQFKHAQDDLKVFEEIRTHLTGLTRWIDQRGAQS